MALPLTGLMVHFDASTAAHLFKTFVSGGPNTGTPVDGDAVAVWESDAVANQMFKQSASFPLPLWRATTPLLPLPCLDFAAVGGGQRLILTNNVNNNRLLSDIITSTASTLLVAFYAESIATSADLYTSPPLLVDTSGYWGAMLSLSGGVPKVLAYNYDGVQTYVRLPVTVAAPHVLMVRHESGRLYASLDGGAESSVASGTTAFMGGNVVTGFGLVDDLDGRIGEMAIYNIALTGTALTDAVTYFTSKWVTASPPVSPTASPYGLENIAVGVRGPNPEIV